LGPFGRIGACTTNSASFFFGFLFARRDVPGLFLDFFFTFSLFRVSFFTFFQKNRIPLGHNPKKKKKEKKKKRKKEKRKKRKKGKKEKRKKIKRKKRKKRQLVKCRSLDLGARIEPARTCGGPLGMPETTIFLKPPRTSGARLIMSDERRSALVKKPKKSIKFGKKHKL
jgi:hypothetical protein